MKDAFTLACSARCMWCQADAAAKMRSLFFWGVTELGFVFADFSDRSVGPEIPLGPIDSPETPVTGLCDEASKKNEHADGRRFVTKADVSVAVTYVIGWHRYPTGCIRHRVGTVVL